MIKPTCYVLFSGGLDSRLALKIMQEQSKDLAFQASDKCDDESIFRGQSQKDKELVHDSQIKFKVICLYYHLPFLKDTRKEIKQFCKEQKAELKIIDYTKDKLFKEYIKIINKPKHGYGVGINPCIDCHLFIINETKKLLKNDFDFIVTGEVLGERPMSQHKKALIDIETESELKGKILRPLSALLLEETLPEKNGLIKRHRLHRISGRSRASQMELARYYKITYPSPAGGCLLCEKVFAERLRDLFKRKAISKINPRDIQLLRLGRHFFFPEFKIIVGRKHEENLLLEQMKNKCEKMFTLKTLPGPSVLLQGKINEASIAKAKELLLNHSKNKEEIVEE